MVRAPKLVAGTLIGIPIQDDYFAVAQVLLPGVQIYFGIDLTRRSSFSTSDILKLSIFVRSNDAEIYNGKWSVIGHRPIIETYPLPNSKCGGPDDRMWVYDFWGEALRSFEQATADETLDFRSSFSPLLVQGAIRAFHGLEPLNQSYEKIFRSVGS